MKLYYLKLELHKSFMIYTRDVYEIEEIDEFNYYAMKKSFKKINEGIIKEFEDEDSTYYIAFTLDQNRKNEIKQIYLRLIGDYMSL